MSPAYLDQVLKLFLHQSERNEVYRQYVAAIGCDSRSVQQVEDIPFLPIELYKSHEIKTGNWIAEHVFKSSGTTSALRSKHFVRSMDTYLSGTVTLFEEIYGSLADCVVLALLPGYAPDSSLVSMVSRFIALTKDELSGFFPDEHYFEKLIETLRQSKKAGKKTILFGVTFSLLEFSSQYNIDFPELIIIETGGMKGRGEELTRGQIHQKLKRSFHLPVVHSEYGMTELFSQAYSLGDGIFLSNNKIKVLPGDLYDPLTASACGSNARLNIIDLNNIDTCSFIATSDIGKVREDGSFEVLGRLDNADIRGCNLLFG